LIVVGAAGAAALTTARLYINQYIMDCGPSSISSPQWHEERECCVLLWAQAVLRLLNVRESRWGWNLTPFIEKTNLQTAKSVL